MEDSSMQGMKTDSETGEKHKAVKSKVMDGSPLEFGNHSEMIPCGIEALIKKASVDRDFRTLLLEKRAEAAKEIDLELTSAEAAILNVIPSQQIETIIEKTTVPDEHRRIFLGKVAAAMLAVLGLCVTGPSIHAEEAQFENTPWLYLKSPNYKIPLNRPVPPFLDQQHSEYPWYFSFFKRIKEENEAFSVKFPPPVKGYVRKSKKIPRVVYVSAGMLSKDFQGRRPAPMAPPMPMPRKVIK